MSGAHLSFILYSRLYLVRGGEATVEEVGVEDAGGSYEFEFVA